MALTVKQRGQHVATFRFVEARLMEILAGWIPTTPEMEAKLLFGPHVWDCAQAADALGKRAHELRLPLQHSLAPVAQYVRVLEALASAAGASRRIAALYEGVLPRLGERYRRYLAQTDALMDAPTVRIVERILDTQARMLSEAAALSEQMPALGPDDADAVQALVALDAAVDELVAEDTAAPARQAA
jgi:hypothetical protein